MRRFQLDSLRLLMVTMYPCKPVKTKNPERHFGIANGIKNVMEDQYALKPALWQTQLFRLQNVKLMMTIYNIFLFHCIAYIHIFYILNARLPYTVQKPVHTGFVPKVNFVLNFFLFNKVILKRSNMFLSIVNLSLYYKMLFLNISKIVLFC